MTSIPLKYKDTSPVRMTQVYESPPRHYPNLKNNVILSRHKVQSIDSLKIPLRAKFSKDFLNNFDQNSNDTSSKGQNPLIKYGMNSSF